MTYPVTNSRASACGRARNRSPPRKLRPDAIQTTLHIIASRNLTVWELRWNTPRSSTSMATTKTLNENPEEYQSGLGCFLSTADYFSLPRLPFSQSSHIPKPSFARQAGSHVVSPQSGHDSGEAQSAREHRLRQRPGRLPPPHASSVAEIDFVEGVGHGVIVKQVVVFFLIGDERRHSFQKKIEVVGAPSGVGGERSGVELFQWRNQSRHRIHHIAASAQGEPGDPSDP